MMRVTSIKAVLRSDGMGEAIRKGNCLIDLTKIQHAFQADNEETEIVMRSGDRFFVKKPTFNELEQLLLGL